MSAGRQHGATATLAAAAACAVLLAGCASAPQTERLRVAEAKAIPESVLLPQVPFIAQEAYQCGPAALAMALAASGSLVDAEQLKAQVYLPSRQGSLQAEMIAGARRHGRLAAELPPRLDAVLQEVANGLPVIVLQNLSLSIAAVWHYAVVIGFDIPRGEIVLHSGSTAGQRFALDAFERTWARSGRWAMVAAAADRLPATVTTADLLGAAAALERVQPAAALDAYHALIRRTPDLAASWFGLGNAALANNDPAQARAAFERSTQIDPDYADAWNNLAHVLVVLRLLDQARAAAQRAVTLGGPRLPRYLGTLAEVEQAHR